MFRRKEDIGTAKYSRSYRIEKNGINQYRVIEKWSGDNTNYYLVENNRTSPRQSDAKIFSTLEEAENAIKAENWEVVKEIK